MSDIDDLLKQTKTVARLAVAKERLTGALETEKKKLMEVYDVANLRQARQELSRLEKRTGEEQKKFDKLVDQIEEAV